MPRFIKVALACLFTWLSVHTVVAALVIMYRWDDRDYTWAKAAGTWVLALGLEAGIFALAAVCFGLLVWATKE